MSRRSAPYGEQRILYFASAIPSRHRTLIGPEQGLTCRHHARLRRLPHATHGRSARSRSASLERSRAVLATQTLAEEALTMRISVEAGWRRRQRKT